MLILASGAAKRTLQYFNSKAYNTQPPVRIDQALA